MSQSADTERYWTALPSDDFVFSSYAQKLGLSSKLTFYELCVSQRYVILVSFVILDGLDTEDNPHIPMPVTALIALMP